MTYRHAKANPEKFGIGRRLSPKHAISIVHTIWPHQEEIAGQDRVEDPDHLMAVILRETGREIRSDKNLNIIRSELYQS